MDDARTGPQKGAPVGSVLARYSPTGGLDRTFGRSGWVMIGPAGRQHRTMVALAIQPSRKIVVAGDATLGNGFSGGFARYKNAGKVDESFGERPRLLAISLLRGYSCTRVSTGNAACGR